MDGFGELGRKVDALRSGLDGTALDGIVKRVALAAKKDGETELDRDLPGRKFHNWKPKLGVGFELDPAGAVVRPRPNGPSKVLTEGREAGSKFSKRAGRTVGWGPTKGHGTWDTTKARIESETPERVAGEIRSLLARTFTG